MSGLPQEEPGGASAVTRGVVAVALLYTAVLLVGLDRPHLVMWDEYYTLDRSAALLETNDWFRITYNHRSSLVKPPAQYWLTALALEAGLPTEFAVRSWSVVFAVGTVLASAWLAMALAPSQPAIGLVAALLVAADPSLLRYARTGLLETGQVLSVAVTLGALFRVSAQPRFWVVAGLAAGLGVLQKAPLALAVAVPATVLLLLCGRLELRAILRDRWFRAGSLIALSLTLFWPIVQTIRFGDLWVKHYWGSQFVERMTPVVGTSAARAEWQYERWIGTFVEWPLPWLLTPVLLAAALATPKVRRCAESWLLLGLAVAGLAGLYLASGRVYPRYLLPLVPLLAVVAAFLIVSWFSSRRAQLIGAVGLVLVQLPALWHQHSLVAVDYSDAEAAGRELRETLRAYEVPVIAYLGWEEPVPPTALLAFANLDRPARMLSIPRLATIAGRMERRSLRGIVLRSHFAELAEVFPRARPVTEFGRVVVWESTKPEATD